MAKKNICGYTLGEEIFSWVSHGVGALLGIAALVFLIIFAAINGDPFGAAFESLKINYSIYNLYALPFTYKRNSKKSI